MQYVPVDNLRGQKEGFYSQDDSIYEPLDNVFEYFDDAVLYPPKELLGNHISGPTFDEVMGAAKAVAKCYPEEEKETVFVVFYKHPDEEYVFQKIFYTEEKASKYCARMNGNIGLLGMFVFKEEEIE